MGEDVHKRAESLLANSCLECISPSEQGWLEAHLRDCARCAEHAGTIEHAAAMLRSIAVPFDSKLVESTRFRVRVRAHELREERARMLGLCISCAFSWAAVVVTAPLVWRGLEWVGERVGIAQQDWMMASLIWWVLPAAIIAAVLIWQKQPGTLGDRRPATLIR